MLSGGRAVPLLPASGSGLGEVGAGFGAQSFNLLLKFSGGKELQVCASARLMQNLVSGSDSSIYQFHQTLISINYSQIFREKFQSVQFLLCCSLWIVNVVFLCLRYCIVLR
jgi:hypothetical protein